MPTDDCHSEAVLDGRERVEKLALRVDGASGGAETVVDFDTGRVANHPSDVLEDASALATHGHGFGDGFVEAAATTRSGGRREGEREEKPARGAGRWDNVREA